MLKVRQGLRTGDCQQFNQLKFLLIFTLVRRTFALLKENVLFVVKISFLTIEAPTVQLQLDRDDEVVGLSRNRLLDRVDDVVQRGLRYWCWPPREP